MNKLIRAKSPWGEQWKIYDVAASLPSPAFITLRPTQTVMLHRLPQTFTDDPTVVSVCLFVYKSINVYLNI